MAPVTRALLIANFAAFMLQMIADPLIVAYFALWPLNTSGAPAGPGFQPWQVITYSFLHGNLMHLLFNMLALYMFGSDIERVFGARRFAVYYLICVVSAAIAQLAIAAIGNWPAYPTVGASGGVFGLLLAFGLYFPRRMV